MLHHPQARDYALAILCGAIAEGGLALALYSQGTGGTVLPLLFLVEAVILGGVFGPGPGIVGSVLPLLVWLVVEWARRAFDIGSEPEDTLGMVFVTVLYLGMVFAFLAGMTGAVRNRYFRRQV